MGKRWGKAGRAVPQTPDRSLQGPGELQLPGGSPHLLLSRSLPGHPIDGCTPSRSPITGTAGSLPAWASPCFGEAFRDRSHPVSFPSIPPPLSSLSSPAAPKLTPPRGVMPGSNWCYTRHNLDTGPSRYSHWKTIGASLQRAPAAGHGGAAGPPCTPRDGKEEAERSKSFWA